MPLVLGLKPRDIELIEKWKKYTISVIGCKKAGIQFAIAFADAGFKVICTDEDQNLLQLLSKGKTPYFDRKIEARINSNIKQGKLKTESDIKTAVSQSKIVILTTSTKINSKNKLIFSKIEHNCKKIGKVLNRGMLVIYGNVASIGYIENTIKEILENTSGLRISKDFGLVYCPIQFNDKVSKVFTEQELFLAGFDKYSLIAAKTIFQTVMKNKINTVLDFKKLEAAILFTIAKNDLELAFGNEIAIFCEKLGLDYFEIVEIVEKNNINISKKIGIEKEEKAKAHILIESADNNIANVKLSILSRRINEGLSKHSIKLAQKALRECGKTLRRAKISIFGSVQPRTTAFELVKSIEKKGAKINIFDPFRPKRHIVDNKKLFKKSFNETVEGTDCLIVLTEHTKINNLNFKKLSARMKTPATIIDLTGTIKPKKAEKAGFIYCGLGRGSEN